MPDLMRPRVRSSTVESGPSTGGHRGGLELAVGVIKAMFIVPIVMAKSIAFRTDSATVPARSRIGRRTFAPGIGSVPSAHGRNGPPY